MKKNDAEMPFAKDVYGEMSETGGLWEAGGMLCHSLKWTGFFVWSPEFVCLFIEGSEQYRDCLIFIPSGPHVQNFSVVKRDFLILKEWNGNQWSLASHDISGPGIRNAMVILALNILR